MNVDSLFISSCACVLYIVTCYLLGKDLNFRLFSHSFCLTFKNQYGSCAALLVCAFINASFFPLLNDILTRIFIFLIQDISN